MHPSYIEDQKRKDKFNNSETVIYTPDLWEEDENNGKKGLTGKDFLDLCGGDYELAEDVFNGCEWQHPATVLDEMKRGAKTGEVYLVRLDETDSWNKEYLAAHNLKLVYGVYAANVRELTNVADIRPSIWLEFVKNESLDPNQIWDEDEDLLSFEFDSGREEGGIYIYASDFKRLAEEGVDVYRSGTFLWSEDEETAENAFLRYMDAFKGNYSTWDCLPRNNKDEILLSPRDTVCDSREDEFRLSPK